MKVVLFVSGFPSHKEPARSVFNLVHAKALKEIGLEVVVVYIRTLRPKRPILKHHLFEGIQVLDVACVIPYGFGWMSGHFFDFIKGKIIDTLDIDGKCVVHCVGGGNLHYAYRLANRYHLPLITQFIGSDINKFLTKYLKQKDFVDGIKFSGNLIFNSGALRHRFLSKFPVNQPVQVIYRGADLSAFHFNFNQIHDEILLLFLGGFPTNDRNLKGGLDLLDCIQLIDRKSIVKKLRFLIGGPNSTEYKSFATANEKIAVEFIGPVTRDEVRQRYFDSHVVLIPSTQEGLPNVLFESMATGNMVIASMVGGIPEVLDQESGALVEPNSPASLARVIEEIQNQPQVVFEKAIKAREKVLGFDKVRAIEGYLEIYSNLYSKKWK